MTRLIAHVAIVIIIVMHVSFAPAWGGVGGGGVEAEQIFGFAEALFDEGDYYRAIGEYKRYIFLSATPPTASGDPAAAGSRLPLNNQTETATFRIAESYFQAKRLPEAIVACNQFLAKYPASSRYGEMLYLKGRLEKLSGRGDDALRTFDQIAQSNMPAYRDKSVYQKALVLLERSDWRGVGNELRQVPEGSPLFPAASALAVEMEKREYVPQKSPTTAGLLAALLPGAGHLYAERPRDALVAFLLNGAFIWGSVELFQHENYVAGGIFAFFELGWYTGNIYSAVSSVHKYNRLKENDFIQKLKNNFSLALKNEGGRPSFIISQRF